LPIQTNIKIFQGPLKRAHPSPAAAAAVEEVVRQEITHDFGISDAWLRERGRA
jgi:hypothetical protein